VSVCASRAVDAPCDPAAIVPLLRNGAHPWLLESALPSDRLGHQSFAGCDPYLVLQSRGKRNQIECLRAVRPDWTRGSRVLEGDPLELLEALLPPMPSDSASERAFCGGAVVALGYELVDGFERLGLRAKGDPPPADLYALFVHRVVACDTRSGRVLRHGLGFGADADDAGANARSAVDGLAERLAGKPVTRRPPAGTKAKGAHDMGREGHHAKAVDAVKREIEAGSVYQVCLTHRAERELPADAWDLYRQLRRSNPAPFASYLELPGVTVVGSSPERFLRVTEDRRVESRPIKGTRPRSPDPELDAALRADLARSEKDRAENLMIVDLVRNDLGRVCETGSVAVPELMRIEDYAGVFQMVSTVTGRLRPDCGLADLIRAAFPPGSMTGAPKIAAMKWIDRLESSHRGLYSGALGYVDARGGLDLCVVIRTALVADGRVAIHSGGGIVADSLPEAELRESLDKVRPLLDALRAVQR